MCIGYWTFLGRGNKKSPVVFKLFYKHPYCSKSTSHGTYNGLQQGDNIKKSGRQINWRGKYYSSRFITTYNNYTTQSQ